MYSTTTCKQQQTWLLLYQKQEQQQQKPGKCSEYVLKKYFGRRKCLASFRKFHFVTSLKKREY